jgi:hypothetical protein
MGSGISLVRILLGSKGPFALEPCEMRSDVRELLHEWEELCGALGSLDLDRASAALTRINAIDGKLFHLWRTRELGSLLVRIARILREIILTPTPLGTISHSRRRTDWWEHDVQWLRDFRELRTDLNSLDFGFAHDLQSELNSLSRVLDAVARAWAKGNTGGAFQAVSVMMLWSASYWTSKGVPTLAVLLVHRALDFCCTAQAWDAGLIYFDGQRPRFASERTWARHLKTDVGLLSVEDELVKTGVWTRDRQRRQFMQALNGTRNQIAFAHGAFRCSDEEAAWFQTRGKAIVAFVTGWAADVIDGPFSLWRACQWEKCLFEFERSFCLLVEEVVPENSDA